MSNDVWLFQGARGTLCVRGQDRIDLLHRLCTNDLSSLSSSGSVVPMVFTTPQGKIVDWVEGVARDDELLLLTSPGRAPRLKEWIDGYTIMEDVHTEDLSSHWSAFLLSRAAVESLWGGGPGSELWSPVPGIFGWSSPRYARAVRLLVPTSDHDAFLRRAKERAIEIIGPERFESRRVLEGVPSAAFEFANEINPLELRLRSAVSFSKGCYIGQEVIARLDSYDKLARGLMGWETAQAIDGGQKNLEAADLAALRLRRDGKTVGKVTSAVSVSKDKWAGLAIVEREVWESRPYPEVTLEGPSIEISARLVDRPFWGEPD